MNLQLTITNSIIESFFRFTCRVDDSQLARIPEKGPLILLGNHINFLEAPLMATILAPRPLTTLAKEETWRNPFLAYLGNLWGAIPIRRGEVDLKAFRRAEEALAAGKILAVAPEGTRSGNGGLQKGRSGVVLLAVKSGVPVLPAVWYGHEGYWRNLSTFRRTDFKIVVGKPFRVNNRGQPLSREVRELIITEMMYQLAVLLPPQYRGCYADMGAMTVRYLDFLN